MTNQAKPDYTRWTPASWQQKVMAQKVAYPDAKIAEKILSELAKLPPLVTDLEINALKKQLAQAANGERFLLQGGDCAESFADCHAKAITDKLKILLQMSLILLHGLRKPIVRVGRMAGQYAKPRSQDEETKNNLTLPVYRGDLINKPGFSLAERTADPHLMLQGYYNSALTLNYIRALVDGGFANLLHPEYWELDFVKHSPLASEYQAMVNHISQSLSFLKAIAGLQVENLHRVDFFTSHEALHLVYEQALTRKAGNHWYNLSTHFPWIGMRTADSDGAHVEYIRGINNPIAVKVSAQIKKNDLINLINVLNPENEPGRLTLIHRLGAKNITDALPDIIKAVQKNGKKVLWVCDPMHGNTSATAGGLKTRRFDDILFELRQAFAIHRKMHSYLGGVHFELTGENVAECIGGARGLTEKDLKKAYKSLVDPRLNYEQALEMAMLIVKMQ